MAGDVPSDVRYQAMAGCSVNLSGDEVDLLHGYWDKLSSTGTITQPMRKQVWGDEFGMCVDEYGVSWMVNVSQPRT